MAEKIMSAKKCQHDTMILLFTIVKSQHELKRLGICLHSIGSETKPRQSKSFGRSRTRRIKGRSQIISWYGWMESKDSLNDSLKC